MTKVGFVQGPLLILIIITMVTTNMESESNISVLPNVYRHDTDAL